jgi:uncharacterized protein
MGLWDFLRRKPKDRVDGYEPTADSGDPWRKPEIVDQIVHKVTGLNRYDAERLDLFKNELTGIGDWLRDKSFGGKQFGPDFVVQFLSGAECQQRWRGSDLGARIVETIPDEMTREGWEVAIQPSDEDEDREDAFPVPGMDPPAEKKAPPIPEVDDESTEQVEALDGKLEELGAVNAVWKALCYERAYGGAAILIGADDGLALDRPLDEERIKDVKYLNVFSGGWDGECVAWSYYQDPTHPKYGMPEMYMIRNIGVPVAKIPAPGQKVTSPVSTVATALIWWVHESRLLIFPGTAVSADLRVQMRGWGDSVFMRINQVLSQYDQTWGGVANLLTDFSQGVLSISGLAAMLSGNDKASTGNIVTDRARTIQMTRSIARLMVIDSEEEFKRDTASLAGISDVLQQFALRLAAAADMPVALLMGQAPAGLNATGASDIRFFYDRIASKQKRRLVPILKRLIKLLMLSKEGPTDGAEPMRWTVKCNSLYQLTEQEQATLRKTVAETDAIYIDKQVLNPEEVAASAYGGSEWSMERTIDLDGRKKMAEQDAKDKAEREKKMTEQMRGAAGVGNPAQPVIDPQKPDPDPNPGADQE